PTQVPRPGRGKTFHVDARDRALLELDRVARSDQPRGELADARLVSDERDARLARVLLQIGDDGGEGAAGGERIDVDDRRLRMKTAAEDLRGLPRAHERTR